MLVDRVGGRYPVKILGDRLTKKLMEFIWANSSVEWAEPRVLKEERERRSSNRPLKIESI